jgi:hypothetical protein
MKFVRRAMGTGDLCPGGTLCPVSGSAIGAAVPHPTPQRNAEVPAIDTAATASRGSFYETSRHSPDEAPSTAQNGMPAANKRICR